MVVLFLASDVSPFPFPCPILYPFHLPTLSHSTSSSFPPSPLLFPSESPPLCIYVIPPTPRRLFSHCPASPICRPPPPYPFLQHSVFLPHCDPPNTSASSSPLLPPPPSPAHVGKNICRQQEQRHA